MRVRIRRFDKLRSEKSGVSRLSREDLLKQVFSPQAFMFTTRRKGFIASRLGFGFTVPSLGPARMPGF